MNWIELDNGTLLNTESGLMVNHYEDGWYMERVGHGRDGSRKMSDDEYNVLKKHLTYYHKLRYVEGEEK